MLEIDEDGFMERLIFSDCKFFSTKLCIKSFNASNRFFKNVNSIFERQFLLTLSTYSGFTINKYKINKDWRVIT